MRTTEESIVYSILSSVRASELTSDEVISERRIRSMIRSHRAEIIGKISKGGAQITDDVFQKISLNLKQINAFEWIALLPPIIYLDDRFGMKIQTPGFSNIPMLGEEEYQLGKFNPINKFLLSGMIQDNIMTIRVPDKSPYGMNNSKGLEVMLQCLSSKKAVKASVILDDPDDGDNYEWTKSRYPLPAENVEDIKKEILRRDFQIILQTKSDQVPNMKNDTLRYNDQGKVQQ